MEILRLVNLSVNRKVTITMLILIIMVFGVLSFTRLGLDMLPKIDFPMITVMTNYQGASPRDVEQLITKVIESQVSGISGVKNVKSSSQEGISIVMIEFEYGTDLDVASQTIRDRIDFVRDYLPEGVKTPFVLKFDPSMMPVMFMGVEGKMPSYQLRKLIDENVSERLERLEGVASSIVMGGDEREIQIKIDPHKLRARSLGIDDIVRGLGAQNINVPAGNLVHDQKDHLLRAIGEFSNIEQIRSLVISITKTGKTIKLGEVANVVDGFKEKRYATRMGNGDAVFMIVTKRSGSNTLLVTQGVLAEIERLKKEVLTPDIKFLDIFNQGEPIKRVTNRTGGNILVGGILAIIFMFFFLRSVRPTLTIAVAIPFSIITTFIAIYVAGFTLNLMTMGGLALGVGMLVDNAVVVIENIYRYIEQGMAPNQAAKKGASEVGMAITSSTMTTIVVFLPILFAGGLASQLARGLALTIMFSLAASLLIALTIVPMLASVIFVKRGQEDTTPWFNPVREVYSRVIKYALDHPWKIYLSTALIVIITVFIGVKFVGAVFMPKHDTNMVFLQMDVPIGTPMEETLRTGVDIKKLIEGYKDVRTVAISVGRDENDRGPDSGISGTHQAQFFVRLKEAAEREYTSMELSDRIRSRLPKLKGTRFHFIDMGLEQGQQAKPVQIKVFGKDFAVLKSICDVIYKKIQDVPGLKDLDTSLSKGRPEIHFKVNHDKAMRYGLTSYQIEKAIQVATLGQVATRFHVGGEEINVRVRLDKQFRSSLEELRRIPIKTPMGGIVPLENIVDFDDDIGPVVINRDNQYRLATVGANTHDRDMSSIVEDVKARIGGINKNLPSGYFIEFGGEFEKMKDAFSDLLLALLLAILLVFMIMAAQFESLTHPFTIMSTLPLALVGVVWMFLTTGTPLSVVTFVGVIILSGVVVNNGIVMIDYINQRRRAGESINDAICKAATIRLRPIIITAGTTILGMLPMAVDTGEGAAMRAPMALTVIGGLLVASMLTLIVLPLVYRSFSNMGLKIKNRFKLLIGHK